jgi:hypothetical protein
VNERRKNAYRYLLYQAMLEIRPIQWVTPRGWRAWSLLHLRRHWRRAEYAGAVADWLHNLAFFAAFDFDRFREDWFWRDFETIRSQFPEFNLERYREHFEKQLTASPRG